MPLLRFLDLVTSISASLSYGILLCLYTQAANILCHKAKASSRTAQYLLLVTTLLFLLGTLRFASIISLVKARKSWESLTPEDVPLHEWVESSGGASTVPRQIAYFVSPLTFLLSDSIIVWRAYVICSRRLWIRVFLVTLSFFAGVFMIFTPIFGLSRDNVAAIESVNTASIFVSLIVNFIATASIGMGARSLCQSFKAPNPRPSPFTFTSLFWFLTEAGGFLCIVQLMNAMLTIYIVSGHPDTDSRRTISGAIFDEFAVQFAAMYPCFVIVLMAGRRSLVDMAISLSRQGPMTIDLSNKQSRSGRHEEQTISAIEFATSPTTTTATHTSRFEDALNMRTSLG